MAPALPLMRAHEAVTSCGWRRLRRRLREIGWLKSHYHLLLALGLAWRDSGSQAQAELNRSFSREDPWDYAGRLERNRHAAELRMLDAVTGGGTFPRALELGCAEGRFTEMLSRRCDSLVAVDLCDAALARARARCSAKPNVRFERWDLRDWPGAMEPYDLIAAVHVLEYVRSPGALRRIRQRLVESVKIDGYLLIGNVYQSSTSELSWWGKYLLHGGNWINRFIASHPSLEVVATNELELAGCRTRDMLLRRVA